MTIITCTSIYSYLSRFTIPYLPLVFWAPYGSLLVVCCLRLGEAWLNQRRLRRRDGCSRIPPFIYDRNSIATKHQGIIPSHGHCATLAMVMRSVIEPGLFTKVRRYLPWP